MADYRRQVISLIAQFVRLEDGPKNDDRLDDRTDGSILGGYQQSRARQARSQPVTEVIEHGAAIMGHQNPVAHSDSLQEFWILHPAQSGIGCRHEINGRFSLPHCSDDVEVKIGVRLKPNIQARELPILARAR